jgi:hypothetical protein
MLRAFPLCLLLCWTPSLCAQDAAPRAAPPAARIRIDQRGFVLPAGAVAFEELIRSAAEFLRRNILFDPRELEAAQVASLPFVFQRELALDALGCEDVLSQLLSMRGFALMAVDADKGLYEVVLLGGQRGRELGNHALIRTPAEILRQPRLRVFVTTELPLEHLDPQHAANAMRQFFSPHVGRPESGGVHFGTSGSSPTLLISGFQDQVARAILLLQGCDVAAPELPVAVTARVAQLERSLAAVQEQLEAAKTAATKKANE